MAQDPRMYQQGNNANWASMMGMPGKQQGSYQQTGSVGATDSKGNIISPDGLSAFWNNSYAPNPETVIGDAYKVYGSSQWKSNDASQNDINSRVANTANVTNQFNQQVLPAFGQGMTDFNAANDQGAQDAYLKRIMGNAYDPNKSGAENYASIDRTANPELYGAAGAIAGQQTPDLLTPNWADQGAYAYANRDNLATSQWNRFDQDADRLRQMPMAQMQTDPGTQNLEYKNWATDEINNQVWNQKGVNYATADKNQIFNYSPEANRAREIIGARLSDGGGENLAYAYGQAKGLKKTGTGADTETAARDQLLNDMSRQSKIGVGGVGLKVDTEGKISDRELRDATQDARAAFNDRGRVRGMGAAISEIMANEDARRARRQENNTNYLNEANVGLANAQNQLQGSIEQGRQNLSRMGQANQVLNDRFDQRLRADNSYNDRMLQSIGALSGTDAQRFSNFQAGVDANMGFDADFQNRVDRYAQLEMQQGGYNTGQTNNYIDQLGGVDDRYQNIKRENNALAAQRAGFANQANMSQEDIIRGRLNDQMGASQDWNNRMITDDAAARARMQDLQGISADYQGRQQQTFANQGANNQQAYNAYMGLRQDPAGQLGQIQGTRLDPNQQMGLNFGIGDQSYMGFDDYMNLNTGLINAEMGYDMQKRMDDSSRKAAIGGGILGLGGSILGGLFG